VKAWSANEQDRAYKERFSENAFKYDTGMVRKEFERRRTLGTVTFERDERAHQGHVSEISLSGYETNPLFHNLGGKFVNVSSATGCGLIDDGRAVIAMDLDRDGDADLVVHNAQRPQVTALRNDLGRGRTVVLTLRGTKSNRFGVGARVVATIGGRRHAQEMSCGSGYLSGPPLELVFGLGDAGAIEKLEIAWPSGARETVEKLAAGRATVEEGKGVVAHAPHARPDAAKLAPPERTAREGDRATVDAADPDGKAFTLPSGRPLVLHFWSSYCRSCMTEVEGYRELVAELKRVDPALEIASLNVDGDPALARARTGAPVAGVTVLVARDGGAGWLPSAEPVVPLTVVVDQDGVVRARHVGAQSAQELAAFARKALGK
jgi:thiol-disulfide isomerase/thioredoxin